MMDRPPLSRRSVVLAVIGAAAGPSDGGWAAEASAMRRFGLGERPFAGSSSWNRPIDGAARFAPLAWPAGARFSIAWDSYSPAVHVAAEGDPVVLVAHPASWGLPGGTVAVRMPPEADGAAGTDGELLVIDGSTVHNFWQFQRRGTGSGHAAAYAATDVCGGSGWGRAAPFLGAGITAAGASQLAGLLVQAETDRGGIAHALQISVDAALAAPGRRGEAIAGDGANAAGLIREGERLAIPAGETMPTGLSPLGRTVWRALQDYGGFVVDVAGGVTHLRAQANAYDRATIVALQSDFARIGVSLQRVEEVSGEP